jgi:hypothetical protein
VSRFWNTRTWWQRILVVVLVLVAVGSAINATKVLDTTTLSDTPSMTACQALDKLHGEMSSHSSFVAAGKDVVNGLSPSNYDIARIQILGNCPQYAEVLG